MKSLTGRLQALARARCLKDPRREPIQEAKIAGRNSTRSSLRTGIYIRQTIEDGLMLKTGFFVAHDAPFSRYS